jgi:hypothetical protein
VLFLELFADHQQDLSLQIPLLPMVMQQAPRNAAQAGAPPRNVAQAGAHHVPDLLMPSPNDADVLLGTECRGIMVLKRFDICRPRLLLNRFQSTISYVQCSFRLLDDTVRLFIDLNLGFVFCSF